MKFKPLHDRIVVKRLAEEQKTAGGILIPDNAQEKPQQGEVMAVGPGAYLDNGEIRLVNVELSACYLIDFMVAFAVQRCKHGIRLNANDPPAGLPEMGANR